MVRLSDKEKEPRMARKKSDKKQPVFRLNSALWSMDDRIKKLVIDDEKGMKWDFKIKALLPHDLIIIGKRTAVLRSGLPYDSLDKETNDYIERQAVLELGVVEHPDWFDIVECPFAELLNHLSSEIWAWSESFKEGLKKNKPDQGSKEE